MMRQPGTGTARAAGTASAGTGSAGLHGGDDPGGHPSFRALRQPPSAGRQLIVHADDFGETIEITRGISLAIEAGVLTSTSIMANMPGTADALPRVAGLSSRASFGVHINLCEGKPLTAGASLVNSEGRFHGKRALLARAVSGRLALQDVEAEIAAQIGLVRDHGVSISHVDGHKHLHQLPVVSTAVANVLPRFGIRRVRITRLGALSRARGATLLVRELLAVQAARKFQRAGLRSPVRIMDLRPLMSGASDAARHCVDTRGPVELCCHPGTAAADAHKPGSHVRCAELEFLLSPRFRELIDLNGARLISYWDV
jgi:chitin disaccharide deacetylase